MSKKRSRTSDFSLELGTKETGKLPTREEIEKTIAEATKKTAKKVETALGEEVALKTKRIPFTTALTPENRATLEAAAQEGRESVADLLNTAIAYYFEHISPLENKEMKEMFLKIFEKKAR